MLYIGDNPEADVDGASQAGIRPVWMTYVRDNNLAFAPGVSPEQKEAPLVQSLRISDWSGLEKLVDSGLQH
jgi:FMN phosphatase YigB (HAD superfamily)